MIEAENHRPSPDAYGRDGPERGRGSPRRDAAPRPPRGITRRGWAVLGAAAAAAVLWGILIVAVAYVASHYSVAQLR